MTQHHGGDLEALMRRHGFAAEEILDLSTGIAPRSWPVPPSLLNPASWQPLPQSRDETALIEAARRSLNLDESAAVCLAPGSQILINLAARLRPPGQVLVPQPAYTEHERAWAACGHGIGHYEAGTQPPSATADTVIAVQPGNPMGDHLPPEDWCDHADQLAEKGGLLVVDEAFADLIPEASLTRYCGREGLLVLRSFGKFYGLAGLRLGLAIGHQDDISRLQAMLGPWAVSTPALQIGAAALADTAFQEAQRQWIKAAHKQLVSVLEHHGITRIGGTGLYVLAAVDDAARLQDHLGKAAIWTRIFEGRPGWIRFGLPGDDTGLARLDAALADWREGIK
ncbi:MAG: threonine-phosphate decarboxylase CobD [Candidatus Puniceispirillales bacterium]